jgi:hypothetical protein
MSQRTRLGVIAAAVAVAIAGFVIASSGGGGKPSKRKHLNPAPATVATPGEKPARRPTAPAVPTVVVKGGKPVGGVATIRVAKGDRVRFEVQSDVGDEVHVHGYDLHKDVARGGTASFAFQASIDGKFEVELERRKQQIVELEVEP